MSKERDYLIKTRQTELQRAFDLATEFKQDAVDEIARMYEVVKKLRATILLAEETIELCKERAIEQGVLDIL